MSIISVMLFVGLLSTTPALPRKTNKTAILDNDDIELVGNKLLHLTTNSANYEGGVQNCLDIHGGTLVNIETEEEREAVYRLTVAGGQDAATVWVGGSVKRGCGAPQNFNPDCWEWNNKHHIYPTLWNDEVESKKQTAMSRAAYNALSDKLDIVGNTAIYQFVCEKIICEGGDEVIIPIPENK